MPAATTQADLLAITDKEWCKLTTLLNEVPPALFVRTDADGWSIKDVIAHRAHWIDLFLGWYRDGMAGREVHFPAEGYKWSELKRYNADLRARQSGLSWEQARSSLGDRHAALRDFMAAQDTQSLYGAPMPGGNGKWTTGRYAEAAGPSHYRSAAKFIRGVQRAAR